MRATGFLSQLGAIVPFVKSVQWPAMAVAAGTAAVVGIGRRWYPRAPLALFAVVAATAAAWLWKLDQSAGLPLVRDRHAVTSGWPALVLPDLSPGLLQSLFIPAAAIVLLGTLELTVTARAGGERPDMRREILAQGWANVAGAFGAAFPASASLGRSALLRLGGALTRVAPAVAAIATGLILLLGGDIAGWIPQASLAGVLFVVAARMIDWRGMRRLWDASRETRLLLIETVAATLLLPLQWAILLGTGTALVIHIANTSAPRLRVLTPDEEGLAPVGPDAHPHVVVIEVSGNLHYAAIATFEEEIERIVPPSARVIVFDLSHAHEIRFAALRTLERLAEEARHDGAVLWLAGVDRDTARLLERSHSSLPWVPEEPVPGLSVTRCLQQFGVR
jgi:SulP family sulfate permease